MKMGRPAIINSQIAPFFETLAQAGYEGKEVDRLVSAALGDDPSTRCSPRTIQRVRIANHNPDSLTRALVRRFGYGVSLLWNDPQWLQGMSADEQHDTRTSMIDAILQRAYENGWEDGS